MPTMKNINQNDGEWQIRGEFDLSALAAVAATRGDGLSTAKTATGTYVVTVKGSQGLRASQTLFRSADFVGASVPATFVRVTSVAHAAAPNQDNVEITLVTSATKGGAAADVSALTTVAFECTVRSGNIGSYP